MMQTDEHSQSQDPALSVIITCLNEEASIELFHERLSSALVSLSRSYEIVLVNDGSSDNTWVKIKGLYDRDPHISVAIDLYKNAGQLAAMTAGIAHARGAALVFMDSDLQLDPEELPALVAKFDEGYDVVSGYRRDRKDSLLRTIPSKLANVIMRKVSKSNLRDFGCTFKIYDGRLVRAFEFGPFKPWRPAYVIARAQRVADIPVSHHPRAFGKSGWTFRKLFAYNMDYLVGLSTRPFQILAAVCLVLAALFLARMVSAWAYDFSVLPEVTPGMILNAVVFSLLLLLGTLCAVGEFVIRNFAVLQHFPAYIIRELRQR